MSATNDRRLSRRNATFDELKSELPDPVAYFLGEQGEGVVYPSTSASYYGHPPSKQYVFDKPREFRTQATAMSPRFSFARGGLAEAWTGGAYAFNRDDLSAFPLYDELHRHYALVARRIGIGAANDDLAQFIPHSDAIGHRCRSIHIHSGCGIGITSGVRG